MDARHDVIVSQAAAASERTGTPVGILLAVGFLESHLGTDRASGGGWGAPIDARHRHTAGTSDTAARILARGRRLCGTWLRGVHFFRCGRCACPRLVGYEAPYALALAARVYARAGVPLPDHWR